MHTLTLYVYKWNIYACTTLHRDINDFYFFHYIYFPALCTCSKVHEFFYFLFSVIWFIFNPIACWNWNICRFPTRIVLFFLFVLLSKHKCEQVILLTLRNKHNSKFSRLTVFPCYCDNPIIRKHSTSRIFVGMLSYYVCICIAFFVLFNFNLLIAPHV